MMTENAIFVLTGAGITLKAAYLYFKAPIGGAAAITNWPTSTHGAPNLEPYGSTTLSGGNERWARHPTVPITRWPN